MDLEEIDYEVVAQHTVQWWASVNTIKSFRIQVKDTEFLEH
jgi:hypothetical protein